MKIIRKNIQEDAPTVSTGAGMPGTGDDGQAFPKGEPLKRYKKDNKESQTGQSQDIGMMRRKTPMMENSGTFAGQTTFVVPSNVFQEARLAKKKGKHWRTYIGEDDHWHNIREYAAKNPKKSIILQCEKTGAMCYARYGKK